MLVYETERAWQALGKVNYVLSEQEKKSLQFRRSVYIAKDIQVGEILTHEYIKRVRPGFGLAPKYIDLVIGKTMKCDAKKGARLSLDMIL
jgi:sialic acid synthase SpsE